MVGADKIERIALPVPKDHSGVVCHEREGDRRCRLAGQAEGVAGAAGPGRTSFVDVSTL